MTDKEITAFNEEEVKKWINTTIMNGPMTASGLEKLTKLIVGNLP